MDANPDKVFPAEHADSFWRKVEKRSPDECWPWRKATNAFGYGVVATRAKKHQTILAHRAAYQLANGPVPAGLFVLHRCDRPGCVNPAHLFLGTTADNAEDMSDKGRGRRKVRPLSIRQRLDLLERELRNSGAAGEAIFRRAYGEDAS